MTYKTSDGHWRVQARVLAGGRYRRVSRNFPTKALAERFEAEVRLKKFEPGFVAAPAASGVTFGEFTSRWLAEYCRVEKAASQWTEDERAIKHYLVPAIGEMPLAQLTRRHLLELKTKLASSTARRGGILKPKTVNNVIGLAKKILATATDWEIIPSNPFAGVRGLPMAEEAMAYWTAEERDFFIRFAGKVDPAFTRLVAVASHTGLRRSELAGLQRYQLDFDKRLIQVSAAYCFKAGRRVERTKNRAVAYLPMNDVVRTALLDKSLAAPSAQIFQPDLMLYASSRLRKLCTAVGVRSIRFHDLRHTFASCLVMAGVEIFTVQRLLRHKTIAMTQRYAHLAPGYLRDAAAKIVADAVNSAAGPDLAPSLRGPPQLFDIAGLNGGADRSRTRLSTTR